MSRHDAVHACTTMAVPKLKRICAVSLCRKVSIEFNLEVSKLYILFFWSNPIEADLLAPKMKKKYMLNGNRLEIKNNECMKLFGLGILSFGYLKDTRALSMNQLLNFT